MKKPLNTQLAMALALPLLLTACASTPSSQSTNTATSTVSQKSAIPRTIDTFSYKNKEVYEDPRLGYSLGYQSQFGYATVYIYPVPESLADKSQQTIIKTMMSQAIGQIRQAESMDIYQDFSITNEQLIEDLPNVQGRVYGSYVSKGQPAKTAIYLTVNEGKLFKIRLTQPNVDLNQVLPAWNRFADQMFTQLIANSDKV